MSTRWRPDLEAIPIDEALTLGVAWKRGKRVEARKIRTAGRVSDALRQACRDTLDQLSEFDAIGYGPDALIEQGQYMAVPRLVVEDESMHILDVLGRASALDTLDPRDLPRTLWFYAAVVGDEPEGRAAFIRKTDPHITARPGRFLATLGETLSRIDEPVFVLETRFDVVAFDDGLIVLRATPFETLFRGATELTERIPVWTEAITEHLPIAEGGAERLYEAAARNSRFARRLRAIYEQGHLAGITIDQLRQEASEQGLDEAALFRDNQLVVDENTDTDTLLRLLNEDLFTGGLSGRKFAADRKTARS